MKRIVFIPLVLWSEKQAGAEGEPYRYRPKPSERRQLSLFSGYLKSAVYPKPRFTFKTRTGWTGFFVWMPLLALCTAPLLAGAATPMTTLKTALLGRAQNILLKSIPAKEITATRDLTNSALSILAAGGNIAQAQQLLTLAFSVQNMNSESPTYGSFPWYYNSSAVTDPDSDDYASQALGPIWLHYGHLFPAAFQAQMLGHMRATLSALFAADCSHHDHQHIFNGRGEPAFNRSISRK